MQCGLAIGSGTGDVGFGGSVAVDAFRARRLIVVATEQPRRQAPKIDAAGLSVAKNEQAAAVEVVEMRAVANGDAAAFGRLIDREAPRLMRFACGILGNPEEAEDVVQDTLLRLWENAAEWTPDARLGTWLHRICYNRSIDRLRRRRNFVDDDELLELSDNAEPADALLVRAETVASIRDVVERLPARQRTAVLLFHFQDLPQREAAAVMDVSEAAFESLLSRARRQMRRWLADNDGGEGG